MTRTRIATVAAVLVAVSFGAVGCGDDDSDSFKEDYNTAVKPLSEMNGDIGGSIKGESDRSNQTIANQFDKLADKAAQTRSNLQALEPPEDAKSAFDELLAALKDGTDDLRAVAEAAKDSDPAAATKASEDLKESGEEIDKAEKALQKAVDG
jgi:hypothetical protein